jgi:hypothetical protein
VAVLGLLMAVVLVGVDAAVYYVLGTSMADRERVPRSRSGAELGAESDREAEGSRSGEDEASCELECAARGGHEACSGEGLIRGMARMIPWIVRRGGRWAGLSRVRAQGAGMSPGRLLQPSSSDAHG